MHYQRWGTDDRLLITSQPGAPASEQLEWACDVKTAIDGTESRQSQRKNPIVALTFEHPIERTYLQDIMSLISINSTNWSVLLWHLSHVIERPATLGATTDVTDTNIAWHGFGTSGTCAVYDPLALEDINILPYTRAGNTLTITGMITVGGGTHVNKAHLAIAPIRNAEVVSSRTISGEVGTLEKLSIEYHLTDTFEAGDLATIPTVDGYDFFSLHTLDADEIDAVENETRVFYRVGGEQFVRNVKQPVVSRSLDWKGDLDSSEQIEDFYYFRSFIWQRQGQTRGFLRNSFRADITSITAVTAATVVVTRELHADLIAYLTQVPYLALVEKTDSGYSYSAHKVTSVTGNGLTINIDAATPIDITKTWLWGELCYMMRLQADAVTFQWNEGRFVESSVSLTSYPISEANKAMTVGYVIS